MNFFAFVSALAALFSAADAAPPQVVRRLVLQDTLIIKVPVRPAAALPRFEWDERKGPKCLATDAIAGAQLAGPSAIDFVMADRSRVRAVMDDDCPALDFYGGFYVEPTDDRLCAKRDEIRSRVGASCQIRRFRSLVAQRKR
jgi:hypothetical protein